MVVKGRMRRDMKVGIMKAIRQTRMPRRRARGVRDGRLGGWAVDLVYCETRMSENEGNSFGAWYEVAIEFYRVWRAVFVALASGVSSRHGAG